MKVLVAVDGSLYSEAVVSEVSSRQWPTGTEVKVVTAFEIPMVPTPEVWVVQAEYYDQMEKIVRERAEAIVNSAVSKLTDSLGASITVTGEILPGSPKIVIIERADQWQADLIVIGSHGYGPWHRFLLGSVSQTVVSHAHCSVEVVRARKHFEVVKAA
jgi:nucleotide-binding universal stress UspA family protein